jgi:hypothetical protein
LEVDLIQCSPEYTKKQSGPVILVGSSINAMEEYREALIAVPSAPVAAINWMSGFVECDFIMTAEQMVLSYFIKQNFIRFGGKPECHVALSANEGPLPTTPFAWSGWAGHRGGSSSLVAALILRRIGFDKVLMVGCPLTKCGYVPNYPTGSKGQLSPDVGQTNVVQDWQGRWHRAKASGELDGIHSISGFTGEILGWL